MSSKSPVHASCFSHEQLLPPDCRSQQHSLGSSERHTNCLWGTLSAGKRKTDKGKRNWVYILTVAPPAVMLCWNSVLAGERVTIIVISLYLKIEISAIFLIVVYMKIILTSTWTKYQINNPPKLTSKPESVFYNFTLFHTHCKVASSPPPGAICALLLQTRLPSPISPNCSLSFSLHICPVPAHKQNVTSEQIVWRVSKSINLTSALGCVESLFRPRLPAGRRLR